MGKIIIKTYEEFNLTKRIKEGIKLLCNKYEEKGLSFLCGINEEKQLIIVVKFKEIEDIEKVFDYKKDLEHLVSRLSSNINYSFGLGVGYVE